MKQNTDLNVFIDNAITKGRSIEGKTINSRSHVLIPNGTRLVHFNIEHRDAKTITLAGVVKDEGILKTKSSINQFDEMIDKLPTGFIRFFIKEYDVTMSEATYVVVTGTLEYHGRQITIKLDDHMYLMDKRISINPEKKREGFKMRISKLVTNGDMQIIDTETPEDTFIPHIAHTMHNVYLSQAKAHQYKFILVRSNINGVNMYLTDGDDAVKAYNNWDKAYRGTPILPPNNRDITELVASRNMLLYYRFDSNGFSMCFSDNRNIVMITENVMHDDIKVEAKDSLIVGRAFKFYEKLKDILTEGNTEHHVTFMANNEYLKYTTGHADLFNPIAVFNINEAAVTQPSIDLPNFHYNIIMGLVDLIYGD